MLRIVFAVLLGTLTMSATSQADDDYQNRGYVQDNISRLSISEQIRIIETEYREQSRGREIPDDQLDFYLDQVRYSNWSLSQIRADMSKSYRGNSKHSNWNSSNYSGWQARTVICSSNGNRYQECRAPFQGRARLTQNISSTRCIEGRNWGSRRGTVWVSDGCRGRFADSYNKNGNYGNDQYANSNYSITCESHNDRYTTCAWNPRNGSPRLVERLSSSRCVEGQTWGYDPRQGIWVTQGCRARFSARY